MTKDQKSLFKKIKKERQQLAFIDLLRHQQNDLGRFGHWEKLYRRRCERKGAACPLD